MWPTSFSSAARYIYCIPMWSYHLCWEDFFFIIRNQVRTSSYNIDINTRTAVSRKSWDGGDHHHHDRSCTIIWTLPASLLLVLFVGLWWIVLFSFEFFSFLFWHAFCVVLSSFFSWGRWCSTVVAGITTHTAPLWLLSCSFGCLGVWWWRARFFRGNLLSIATSYTIGNKKYSEKQKNIQKDLHKCNVCMFVQYILRPAARVLSKNFRFPPEIYFLPRAISEICH